MNEDLPALEIEKDSIPYIFNTELDGKLYNIGVNYNENADMFTLDIGDMDEWYYYGIPIVYGYPVYQHINDERLPDTQLIAYDLAGEFDRVTEENLNEQVFLFVVESEAE